MAQANIGSKTGNASITRIGHTQGQYYGTNSSSQPPLKQTPTDLQLK